LREEVQTLTWKIETMQVDLINIEYKCSQLERALTDEDREALASIARGRAWVKRVVRHTGKHPSQMTPTEWLDVPLSGQYLGDLDGERVSNRAITLCIRP